MSAREVSAAYRRAVEQVSSDERLLGVLPDELSQTVLDWTVDKLKGARDSTQDATTFNLAADDIRLRARRIAGEAAAAGDDKQSLVARLKVADGAAPSATPAVAGDRVTRNGGVTAPDRDSQGAPKPEPEPEPEQPAPTSTPSRPAARRAAGVSRRWWLFGGLGAVLVLAAVTLTVVVRCGRGEEEQAAGPPPPQVEWYEVLFTTPQRTGMPPAGSSGRLDEQLVKLIDGAQRSVDIAAYDFGLENVAEALIRAKERGVNVRAVTDTDNLDEPAMQRVIAAGIPVVDDQRSALMHHKFAVIDGRAVMTGAWNFAEGDTFKHNNNSVIFQWPALARNFSNEFEKMFTARRFGPRKPKDVPNPVLERDGVRVETYYSSELDVEPAILERIRAAKSSIAFMTFSFTLDGVGVALTERARNGVGVWGVVEATGSQTEFSEFSRLSRLKAPAVKPPFPGCVAGPAVLQDGNPYLLHHKVFIIDERTVIFGSFNFTQAAERENDEALLIVDDPALAKQFLAEFCRVYDVAVERQKSR
jgi:phosphatidylserine/phosphatidylglycerophosphate/cardiolipin synthase-like enzyme